MNREVIIESVEIYEKPKQFTMKPEWYHIKKLDHELPEDIKEKILRNIQRLKMEKLSF